MKQHIVPQSNPETKDIASHEQIKSTRIHEEVNLGWNHKVNKKDTQNPKQYPQENNFPKNLFRNLILSLNLLKITASVTVNETEAEIKLITNNSKNMKTEKVSIPHCIELRDEWKILLLLKSGS